MTKNELIELLNEMYMKMQKIAFDFTEDPCNVQDDVNELYNLAQFLPYDCEADDDDDWDDDDWDDDDWDDDDFDEIYETGKADGYEEGYEAGYNEGLKRGRKA